MTWKTAVRRLRVERTRWLMVRGPMSAAIATVMDVGWAPVLPNKWLNRDKSQVATFDAIEGVTEFHVKHAIERDLKIQIWQHASVSYCAKGLEHGAPNFGPASKAYDKLIKQSMPDAAKALETIVTNRSWPGQRLMDEEVSVDDEHIKCARCGIAVETPLHRRWQCPANDHIDHWSIKATRHLRVLAAEDTASACLWLRGILPANLIAKPTEWIDEKECEAIEVENFAKISDIIVQK